MGADEPQTLLSQPMEFEELADTQPDEGMSEETSKDVQQPQPPATPRASPPPPVLPAPQVPQTSIRRQVIAVSFDDDDDDKAWSDVAPVIPPLPMAHTNSDSETE